MFGAKNYIVLVTYWSFEMWCGFLHFLYFSERDIVALGILSANLNHLNMNLLLYIIYLFEMTKI